ncbi:DEAD DEAH box helicase [Dimargaris xerosporica]|nr:DEAD DEAH box helicase [Dimargaris xerosporica]
MLALDQRQSTLVFAVDVAHIHSLAAAFQAHNIDARTLSGQTRREDRVDLLAQFARREFPVLINCAILTEGTDIPAIDCIVMARPTRSAVLYQQMVGRGLRLAPGKTDCLIIDLVDVLRSRANVITTPSLTGVDPQVILSNDPNDSQRLLASAGEGGDLIASQQLAQDAAQARASASPTKVKLHYYEDPFQAQGDCSGDPQLQQLSRYAWVKVSDTLYAVVIQQLYSICVEQTDSQRWRGYYRMRRLSRFPTAPTVIITNQPTWTDALEGCDTWIAKSFKSTVFDQRTAPWRQKPASEAQRQELERRKIDLSLVTKGHPEALTKGMASNLILRLSLGAGKAWKKKKKSEAAKQLPKPTTPALPTVQVGFITQLTFV